MNGKRVFAGFFGTIIAIVEIGLLSGCATDKQSFVLTNTGMEETLKQIEMSDEQKGWALTAENELLHTTSGIENFTGVKTFDKTLQVSGGEISLCAVDENTAYTAYFSMDGENILVEYTTDAGENWKDTEVSYASYGGAYKAYLSFADREHGYLLYCSDPGAGMMTKILFSTEDGGETWQSMELPRYDVKDSLYIEGTAPVFFGENQKQGKLLLQYVTAEKRNTILYTSEDGGENWTPQQELECDSVRSYDFFSENDGYLVDETGCLLQLKASAGTAW